MVARTEPVEVLVIGAGAAGAAFSWSLSRAGIDVLCLDQGGWVDPKAYGSTLDDWQLHRYAAMHPDPNVRRLPSDYPLNNDDTPIMPLMYNAVGGSTIHWSAHFPRLRPSDFRVRSLDGVADDWPVTYAELEPYFDLNDQMTGVSGMTGDPAYPPKSPRQTPPIPLGRPGETIARGFDRLGWHWWPSDSAIISRPYDGRAACNNCGPCDIGCAAGAKASTDVTYWPKALAQGVQLITGARVREITVTADGRAGGVLYYDRQGQLHEQRARAVVVACNGIGTPRLLLNSRSGLFPDGLANSSGMVGANLMFHPYAVVQGVFDEPLESYKGPNGCSVNSQHFYETDLARGFVRGYSFQISRGPSNPVAAAIGGVGGSRVPWGSDHHAAFAERHDRMISVVVIGEDLPELHNRVTIDKNLTDSDGIAAPKVSYTLSENSRRMMEHGVARGQEVLEAAGARRTFVTPLLRNGGFHLMGTARMGIDPSRSVVNGDGRAHDVPNLYVIDGSVMPTCGGVNPTSTIQATALYLADRFIAAAKSP